MEPQAVLEALRAKAKPNTARIYRRHGVRGETYGVPYAVLGQLVKQIGVDHALALTLWESGIHDARVLAAKLAAVEQLSQPTLAAWMEECDNYVLNGALSALAARMPSALELAEAWTQRRSEEWFCAAGWNIYASLAYTGALEVLKARELIARIQTELAGAKNRARHSMNNALISIGGSIAALREEALAAARAMGKVKVDHGETDCKTPDAAAYIQRMVARQAQ